MADEALPLPSLEEVLICNPSTTAEEVRANCVHVYIVHYRVCIEYRYPFKAHA